MLKKPNAPIVRAVFPDYPSRNIWITGIALIGVFLYVPTLEFGFTLDDALYAYENSVTRQGLTAWQDIFRYGSLKFAATLPSNAGTYRPLTLLSFAVEKEIFGGFYPRVGHAINLFLYFGCLFFSGQLLFSWFRKMGLPVWVPALSLLLFAIHPIHTEVVVSIKSRDTLLAAFLGLGALWGWYHSYPGSGLFKKFAIGFLFFLSLLSKEETITFVVLVPFICVSLLQRSLREALFQSLTFLIPALIYLCLRVIILDPADPGMENIINNVIYATNTNQRIATNFWIYLFYLKLLVFPYPLSWDYSYSQVQIIDFTNPLAWLGLLLFAYLLFYVVKSVKRQDLLSFGIAGYLITFFIFSNLHPSITIGATVAERFLFIPSLFFCMLLGYSFFIGYNRVESGKLKMPFVVVVGLICFLLALYTVIRSSVWKNNLALYQSGVKTSPDSWRTHMFLGVEYLFNGYRCRDAGNVDSSRYYVQTGIDQYEKAFEIIGNKANLPQFKINLADAYALMGDTTKAIGWVSRIRKGAKDYPRALFKLGYWSFEKGDYDNAIRYFEMVLDEMSDERFKAYKNLGLSYQKKGAFTEAIRRFEKALEIALPGDDTSNLKAEIARLYVVTGDGGKMDALKSISPEMGEMIDRAEIIEHLKRGSAFYQAGDYANARAAFKQAEAGFERTQVKALFPKYYEAYAHSCLLTGDTLHSKRLFLKAMEELTPNAFIFRNLGTIEFFREKNYAKAEQYFRKGIAAGTDKPLDDYRNLGSSLLIQGKKKESMEAYEKALTYGKDIQVIKNLYLLYKEMGDEQKAAYYQAMMR